MLIVLILALLMVSVAFLVQLYVSQDRAIYPQTISRLAPPDIEKAPFDHLALTAKDGVTLRGVLFPAQKTSSPTLVIAFGGNAQDAVGFATYLKTEVLEGKDVAVLGFSYRGYPNGLGSVSGGSPSEPALKEDALLIYDEFKQRVHPGKIYAVGYSLGSAVATYLATQRPLDGLVLVAAPASIRRIAEESYPYVPAGLLGLLLKSPWETERIIGDVKAPVTLIHTPTDGLIPPSHAQVLLQAHPGMENVELLNTTHGQIIYHPDFARHFRHAVGIE